MNQTEVCFPRHTAPFNKIVILTFASKSIHKRKNHIKCSIEKLLGLKAKFKQKAENHF